MRGLDTGSPGGSPGSTSEGSEVGDRWRLVSRARSPPRAALTIASTTTSGVQLGVDRADGVAHGLVGDVERAGDGVVAGFPDASISRTSRSRSVRSGNGCSRSGTGGRAVAKYVATFAASAAPKTIPPPAAARTAFSTSSAPEPLSRYPDAPARIALSTVSSSSFIVSITTRTSGCRPVMKRVASMPSRCGIWMSITTTSGVVSSTTCRASRPSSAEPTTSTPSSAPSSATSPSRTMAWSSTTTTDRRDWSGMRVPPSRCWSAAARPGPACRRWPDR